MDFDVIPYDDIRSEGEWKKLGSGSFGNVYKATYLGIDVAVKEVLPSSQYDVGKYFEREWRIMKEARHPNVVLYLGLSRAPPPDGRIFIISEFIEGGNLRQYIHDKSKPFGWRLRLSFMTDIARALAYLHARKCIHRDMKGENLLVTSNGRLKVTDFGFARIAARNEEESRRLTFCGTDAYMSPEILIGDQFDLPTDIFSLGIIFCEIIARKLADDYTFKRSAPFYDIDEQQVRKLASAGCPPDLITLALQCCDTNPAKRPTMVHILSRLRAIEVEVVAAAKEGEEHVGSIKFASGARRPGAAPRIPSFGQGVGSGIRKSGVQSNQVIDEQTDSEDELEAAIKGLGSVKLNPSTGPGAGSVTTSSWIAPQDHGRSDTRLTGETEAEAPLIDLKDEGSSFSEYSTTVIRGHAKGSTITPTATSAFSNGATPQQQTTPTRSSTGLPRSADSLLTIDSYHTAKGLPSVMAPSIAAATEGSHLSMAMAAPAPMPHRFTLIKPGAKRNGSISPAPSESATLVGSPPTAPAPVQSGGSPGGAWSPFDFFFFSGGLGAFSAKCDQCGKRLGWKPLLECDDCGLRAHLRCGDDAPNDCGLRPPRVASASPSSGVTSPLKHQHHPHSKKLATVASASTPNFPSSAPKHQ